MSFDRLASHYAKMEAVLAGGLLQRCRVRWLPEVRKPRRVLLVGEGNGKMLAACASVLPDCQFTVLDQSEGMLAQARRCWQRISGKQKIIFQRADIRDWHDHKPGFDLVVTNFFLDCFNQEELPRVITNISSAASLRAQWLLADFCVPSAGWRRVRAQAVLALAYGFFRFTTSISASRITDPDEALHSAGFALHRREWFNQGLLHADLWSRGD